jgi:hypothetical protein
MDDIDARSFLLALKGKSSMSITSRDNLISALEGQIPERIPYTIYEEDFITSDPAWQSLLDMGLCRVAG